MIDVALVVVSAAIVAGLGSLYVYSGRVTEEATDEPGSEEDVGDRFDDWSDSNGDWTGEMLESNGSGYDYTIEDDELSEITVGGVDEETSISGPVPENVTEKDSLTDITGIGPAKAQKLEVAGYDTPEDVFYAADTNLTDISGFGPAVVSQIREDIGYLGDE